MTDPELARETAVRLTGIKIDLSEKQAARFWSGVNILGPSDCWKWTRELSNKGYGRFIANGHTVLAHRVAFTLGKEPIPSGLLICHSCDNPPCCNPAHLHWDT